MDDDLQIRPIVWLGDSRKNIQQFPSDVQKDIGDALQVVQFGGKPKNAKPFSGVGSGVLEIVKRYDSDTYRAVYAVQVGKSIYILHDFQKKSPQGIKTAQKDVDVIKRRYKEAQSDAKNDQ
ncbi:MAG: type II toxin-antitoxin system RelE/ParE family toxin [Xenococcaceae cyanobacterium]